MRQYKIHIAFLIIALLHLYSIYANFSNLRFFSKPLICAFLFLILYRERGLKNRFNQLIGTGLIFGWLGDIFLMMHDQFLLGLISFLVGHILYVIAFIKQTSVKDLTRHKVYILVAGILLTYSYYLFNVLEPSLGIMKIPVILYIFVIPLMALFAFTRRHQTNTLSFIVVFIGAILFIISDSILALNKFVAYIPNSDLYIMSTYILAQYGITLGTIFNKNQVSPSVISS